jgi:hypothetical protein
VWTFTLPNSRHPQFNSRAVPHSQHIYVRVTLHIPDFILRVLITATVIAAGATLQLTTLEIHPSQELSLYHSILSITSIARNYDHIYRRKSTVARSQDSSICSSACFPSLARIRSYSALLVYLSHVWRYCTFKILTSTPSSRALLTAAVHATINFIP